MLHDLGHMVNDQCETPTLRGVNDRHECIALPFLRGSFDDAVLQPIRLQSTPSDIYALAAHGGSMVLNTGQSYPPTRSAALNCRAGFLPTPKRSGSSCTSRAGRRKRRLWDDGQRRTCIHLRSDRYLALAKRIALQR